MSVYVYAIVGPRDADGVSAAAGPRLWAVRGPSAAAIVEDREISPSPTRRALRAHDLTVRRIAAVTPAVLPVRFGTIVHTDRALASLLRSWSADLRSALGLVDGREQMTLRLFGAPIAITQPERGDLDDDPGTRHLIRRAAAHARAQFAPELEPLRQALGPLVQVERVARQDAGPLLLTAYHLIPRGASSQYRSRLQQHAAAFGLRAVVSGPWPPYAFVPGLRA